MSGEGNDAEEQEVPSALEETGRLEADVGTMFDHQLANIDPRLKMEMDPQLHQELRAEMLFIREELRQAKWQTLAVRRVALKKLILSDALVEDCLLRNIGRAYAASDP